MAQPPRIQWWRRCDIMSISSSDRQSPALWHPMPSHQKCRSSLEHQSHAAFAAFFHKAWVETQLCKLWAIAQWCFTSWSTTHGLHTYADKVIYFLLNDALTMNTFVIQCRAGVYFVMWHRMTLRFADETTWWGPCTGPFCGCYRCAGFVVEIDMRIWY